MAMSKALREELRKMGLKNAKKRWKGTTPEERTQAARHAALAKHRKLGHKMTADAAVSTNNGEGQQSKDAAA